MATTAPPPIETKPEAPDALAPPVPPKTTDLPPRSPYYTTEFSLGSPSLALPTDNSRAKLLRPLVFSVHDPVLKVCVVRQTELYGLPQMNELLDLFLVLLLNSDRLKRRIGAVEAGAGGALNCEYWKLVLDDRYSEFVRDGHIDELEQRLDEGIPQNLRGLVYLKTMQVRYHINHRQTFAHLLAKANLLELGKLTDQSYVDGLHLDAGVKDVLKIFNYYTNEVVGTLQRADMDINNPEILGDAMAPQTPADIQPPNYFVIHICQILAGIPNLDQEEMLYLLLKFNKLFCNLILDEFFYKVNRLIEAVLPQAFKHIGHQGVNLVIVYKKVLYNFFTDKYGATLPLTLKILDFFVFEGFDVLLRLVVWCFVANQSQIMDLEGDLLAELLGSHAFWNVLTPDNFSEVLQVQPDVIKYENEFHLVYANLFNNKNTELNNLRDTNDNLIIKMNQLRRQLELLRTTHDEILQQNSEYKEQLTTEVKRRAELDDTRAELQRRFETMLMKENISNTKKANAEFAARNDDLEKQIAQLKESIALKKAKLGRE